MALPQEERRKYVRLNVLVDVAYSKRSNTKKGKPSLRFSRNISKGGICVIVYEKMKKGELIDLQIFFQDKKIPIKAVARVAWVSEFIIGDSIGKRYDVGLEFLRIKESDREKIDKYVFTHLKTS